MSHGVRRPRRRYAAATTTAAIDQRRLARDQRERSRADPMDEEADHNLVMSVPPRVAVAVVLVVIVLRAGDLGAVEHHAENLVAPDGVDRPLHELVRRRAGPDHQHRAVHHRGEQVRVGQQHHGRRVDDDPVERLLAPRRAAAACAPRSGRPSDPRSAGRPAAPPGAARPGARASWSRRPTAARRSRPSAVSSRNTRVERRPPQVGVDEQHALLVRLAEREREVEAVSVLPSPATALATMIDAQPGRVVRVVQHRREPPVLLARGRAHVVVDDDLLGEPGVEALEQRALGRRRRRGGSDVS